MAGTEEELSRVIDLVDLFKSGLITLLGIVHQTDHIVARDGEIL